MTKAVKSLITKSYTRRFGQADGAVLVDITGVPSNSMNKLRAQLAQHKIKVSVVKNSLACKVAIGTSLQGLDPLAVGPTTLVYGGESVVNVARELLPLAKEIENLKFKGAVMQGQLFGPEQIEKLSKYPTRAEAQAQLVQLALSPGRNLAASVLGPGGKIASLVKAIQEKLEKGAPAAA